VPAPRQRLTREEKKAQTRERLVDAASRVFARQGFAATTLDEVAEEAGLTKGAVYSNFDSKEDLVRAVLDERLERQLLAIPRDVQPGASTEEDAARASEQYGAITEHEVDKILLGLEYAIYAVRNPDFREQYIAQHREANAAVARVIEERLLAGGDEPQIPSTALASVFSAVTSGVTLERLRDPDSISDDLFGRLLAAVTEAFVITGEQKAAPD
jgi:AcrR family transcriptional regulator